MSTIKDRKSNSSGAYERILGSKELDVLISKLHATTISAGRELEKIVLQQTNACIVNDLNDFKKVINNESISNKDIYLIPKEIIQKSHLGNKNEPDFIIIEFAKKKLNIIELKEGYTFDTKKSKSEFKNLEEFRDAIAPQISYKTDIFICCFHENDKKRIFNGFKKKIPLENIMNGEEFQQLLGIKYCEIRKIREKEMSENFDYFVTEFINIPEVKEKIKEKNESKDKK